MTEVVESTKVNVDEKQEKDIFKDYEEPSNVAFAYFDDIKGVINFDHPRYITDYFKRNNNVHLQVPHSWSIRTADSKFMENFVNEFVGSYSKITTDISTIYRIASWADSAEITQFIREQTYKRQRLVEVDDIELSQEEKDGIRQNAEDHYLYPFNLASNQKYRHTSLSQEQFDLMRTTMLTSLKEEVKAHYQRLCEEKLTSLKRPRYEFYTETETERVPAILFRRGTDYVVFVENIQPIKLLAGSLSLHKKRQEKRKQYRQNGFPEELKNSKTFCDYDLMPEKLPNGFGGKPLAHQWTMFHNHMVNRSSVDLSKMGVGKTLASLMAIRQRIFNRQVNRVVIICPNAVKGEWVEDAEKFNLNLNIEALNGTTAEKAGRLVNVITKHRAKTDIGQELEENEHAVFVINYEAFAAKVPFGADKIPFAKFVSLMFKPDMVILDEAHKIKNPDAKRTKHILKLIQSDYKIIMSGTINANKPYDILIPFYFTCYASILFDNIYNHNGNVKEIGDMFREFVQLFCERDSKNRLIITRRGFRVLRSRMEEIAVRFEREECLDLPDKIYKRRVVELTDKETQMYMEIRDLLQTEIENEHKEGKKLTAVHILGKMIKLAQAANGWVKTDDGTINNFEPISKMSKMKYLLETVEEIEEESEAKIIIWTRFTHDIHNVYKTLRTKYEKDEIIAVHSGGLCPVCQADNDNFSHHIDRFKDPNNPAKFLVLNSMKGSHGLNLGIAKSMIFLSNSFVKTDRAQCEDRNMRADSDKSEACVVFDLVSGGTIDQYILEAFTSWKSVSFSLLESLGLDAESILNTSLEDSMEQPAIQHTQQGKNECFLASLVMLCGGSLQDVRIAIREKFNRGWDYKSEEMKDFVCDLLGVELKLTRDTLPDSGRGILLTSYKKNSLEGHAVVFVKNIICDPGYDKPMPRHEWLALHQDSYNIWGSYRIIKKKG